MHEPHATRATLVEPEPSELPAELVREVERGGYYPALVTDVVRLALAGEDVRDHLVHLETTFDTDEVRRHVTVMVLTDTRLLVAHVDDHPGEDHPADAVGGLSITTGPDVSTGTGTASGPGSGPSTGTGTGASRGARSSGAHDGPTASSVAASSVESVPLHQVGSVVVSHRVVDPARHTAGQAPSELVLTVGWGALRRVDLEPATCGDPDCEADHGYTGTIAGEDVSLRVSADAEGTEAVRSAARFARSLTAASLPGAVRPGATAG